jgi:hypothetical protein
MTAGRREDGLAGLSWERTYRWQVSKEAEPGVFGEAQSRMPLQLQAVAAARFWEGRTSVGVFQVTNLLQISL